jgi:hypothetical protein
MPLLRHYAAIDTIIITLSLRCCHYAIDDIFISPYFIAFTLPLSHYYYTLSYYDIIERRHFSFSRHAIFMPHIFAIMMPYLRYY